MKITKARLTQIIKEELEDTSYGRYWDDIEDEEDEYDRSETAELNRTEKICFEIFHSLQDLSGEWSSRRQGPEGQKYQEELDAILAQMNGGEEY